MSGILDCCSVLLWLGFLSVCAFLLLKLVLQCLERNLRISNITQKYVLITGCDTGFGRLICGRFDKLGCHVLAGCYTESGRVQVQDELSSRALVFTLDVTDHQDVLGAYEKVSKVTDELWALVNNAGHVSHIGPVDLLNKESYQKIMDVNFFGAVDMTITFLPLLRRARGRIVNISSAAAFVCAPLQSPYSVSKSALQTFSSGCRKELYPFGVSVHTVNPGYHVTSMTTAENLNDCVDRVWSEASEKRRRVYGEHFPAKVKRELSGVYKSTNNERVLDAYENAVFSRLTKSIYRVGCDAQFAYYFSLMPFGLVDFIWERVYGRF